jgi:glycosyltransferase involved in cell wall biosynthesis
MKIKKRRGLTLLTTTFNSQETVEKTLKSVENLVDEIVVVDDGSTDKTIEIVNKYKGKIIGYRSKNLGLQYQKGLKKVKTKWVLILDSDEYLSDDLYKELKTLFLNKKKLEKHDGYFIPFQNHFLGKPVNFGGEDYKMLRLFRKNKVIITPEKTHQKYLLRSKKVGFLTGKIIHYSYRSLWQTYKKFTYYGLEEAKKKFKENEKITLKKLFFYPVHMFYARFIKDKGYKDGLFRIPLDLGFAYMEFLTYFILLCQSVFDRSGRKRVARKG